MSNSRIEINTPEHEMDQMEIDAMLNTKGFVEFLAQYPEDVVAGEKIKKIHEVFEAKEVVKNEINEIYTGHIAAELGFVLEPKDLDCVDAHFEQEAINNPDFILEYREKLRIFKALPKQIQDFESEINQAGRVEDFSARLEELKETRKSIDIVKDDVFSLRGILSMLGDVQLAKEAYKAVRNVRREGLSLHVGDLDINAEVVDTKIKEIEETISTIKSTEQLKSLAAEYYGGVRKDILGGIGASADIARMLRKKAVEEMKALSNGRDYDSLQEQFETFKKVSSTLEIGVNLFEGVNPDELQKQIDENIEREVLQGMTDDIKNMKLGENNLTTMERNLEFYLKKEKMGSKEGDEVKKFLGKTIAEIQKKLGNSIEDKAKKILLARILIKLKI